MEDWQKQLYGNVYKSEKTKNAAAKRKKTNEAKSQRQAEAYDQAFTSGVKSYASQNNLQYSDDLKQAAKMYYQNKDSHAKFVQDSVNESKRRNKSELKSYASFAANPDNQSKIDEYNAAKKKMGMQPDNMVTQKKYNEMFGYDSKKGYDTGTINRYQQYLDSRNSKDLKVNHNEKKSLGASFDKKVDNGLNGLTNFIGKVKNSKLVQGTEDLAKKIDDTKIGHAYKKVAEELIKHTPAGQQVQNMKVMNNAMPVIDQYGGAASTRNVLADLTDGKNQTAKQYIEDIKGGFTGKKNTKGEEIAKNLGVKSKYGGKAAGLGIELLADPTNFIPAGIAGKVLKSGSKLAKLAKEGQVTGEAIKAADIESIIAKSNKTGKMSKSDSKKLLKFTQEKQLKEAQLKQVADEEAKRLDPNLYPKNIEGLHIIKDEYPMDVKASLQKANEQIKNPEVAQPTMNPNTPIEAINPKQFKSLNDLKASPKVNPGAFRELITPKTVNQNPNPEVTLNEMQNQTPNNQQLKAIDQLPNEQRIINQPNEIKTPVSIADNFQNAISKAKETNNPQDIESIKQHTQDLINDLDTNYKDPDTEEVKNALSKLNLQLFAGKEPVQDTLNKIEGVVERAKTLKKDIKETNPQLAKEIQGIKDINSVGKASRNLYEVVDKLPKPMQNAILSVLNKAKPDNVNYQKMYVEDLNRYIVDAKTGLGIKKGSKDSALVQDYGEKTLAKKELEKQGLSPEEINKMNPEELAKMNDDILKTQYPDKYEAIKKADNFFRERYKELIDAANSTIAKIYPGQPDKLIPERADYYHHFNEMEGLEGVINQFRTPENINPDLVTISHGTQPKTKWQAFKQKRGLGEYKSDAVGGFLKYIQGVSHTTHVDPVIPAIRNVVKDLQNATEDTKNINNIIEALNDHADDIAGKTNPYDRTIQKVLGRANLRRLNALNGRVKSNMILGNVGSTVAQVGNLPLIAAKAKHHLPTGLYDTLEQFSRYATKNKKELPIQKSKFLRERFIDEDFSKFDTKILDQPKKLAVKMMTMVDKATASLAWNSFHRQGLAKKVPNPIEYADKLTRDTIAGRGVGEMGLGQKSKTAQIFMPFTYEVGHQWKVLNNMVGKKDAAGIMTFLITSYALNKVIEDVRGSGVTFDPIDALIDGYQNGEGDKKHKVLAALGSLSGEVVGNIPGGNTITGAIGDKKLFGSDVSLKDIFQDRDPNRFGSGLTVSKAIESPSFALLPFGANQIKKGWESHKAIKEGGVFTKKGQMMYPVDTSSNLKKAQMFTFGKYSPSEAKEYFDEKRLPLSPKRTEKVQKADDKFKEYNNQLIQLLENKKKRNKGDLNKLKKINQQIANLKEKNK